MHFTLSINVFCTNVLIEHPIFTSPSTGPHKRLAISSLLFLLFQLFFKTLALGYWFDLWNRTLTTSKRAPAIENNVGCQSRNPLCITFFLVIVPAQTPTTFRFAVLRITIELHGTNNSSVYLKLSQFNILCLAALHGLS